MLSGLYFVECLPLLLSLVASVYACECTPWRDFYLENALEPRQFITQRELDIDQE